MLYKLSLLTFFLGASLTSANAQTAKELVMKRKLDSMKMAILSDYATRYPALRQGFLTTDIIGSSSIKAELNGKELFQGNMAVTRIRSNFNIPIAHWGKNAISGMVTYQRSQFQIGDIQSFSPTFSDRNRTIVKSAVGFTTTFSRADSILGHPVNLSGSVSGLTDNMSELKRINYAGAITVPLHRSQSSSLSVGLLAIIDPSAVAPLIPIVSYWRKFSHDLDMYFDFPLRAVLRKQLSKRSWAFAGSELGGNVFFFNFNQQGLPENSVFSSAEVRTGFTYEYLLTRKLVFGINGGVYSVASPRLFDRNDKPTNYFARSNGNSSPYVSFSLSLLPFIKSLK